MNSNYMSNILNSKEDYERSNTLSDLTQDLKPKDNYYSQANFSKTPNSNATNEKISNNTQNKRKLLFKNKSPSSISESSNNNLEKYNELINQTTTYGSNDDSKIIKENNSYLNLEDLMILEEKLYMILENFRCGKPSSRNCYEWWNYYNYCTLVGKLEYFFKDETSKRIVREFSIFEFLAVIISYDASNDNKILNITLNILKNLLYVIHQSFLIVCEFLVSKISSDSFSNMWVNKIQNLILTKLNKRLKKGENVYLIKQNNENILSSFKNLFRTYPNRWETIGSFLKNRDKISVKYINNYFMTKILKISNKNASVPASVVVKEGESLPSIPVPYLSNPSVKKFTLVLDLDETLVHFKIVKIFYIMFRTPKLIKEF